MFQGDARRCHRKIVGQFISHVTKEVSYSEFEMGTSLVTISSESVNTVLLSAT